jgi:hypothetical protein
MKIHIIILVIVSFLKWLDDGDWIFLPEFTIPVLPIFFYLFVVAVLSAPWSRERVARVSTQLGQQQVSITLDSQHAASQTGVPTLH